MKKLVILALGLSLAIGTTIALAQDAGSGSSDTSKKKEEEEEGRRRFHHSSGEVVRSAVKVGNIS